MTSTAANLRTAANDSDGRGINNSVDILSEGHASGGTKANEDGGGTHLDDKMGVEVDGSEGVVE